MAWINRDDLTAMRHWTAADIAKTASGFVFVPTHDLRPDWQTRFPTIVMVAGPPIALLLLAFGVVWVGKGLGISISAEILRGWRER